jgi:hypothetical protein
MLKEKITIKLQILIIIEILNVAPFSFKLFAALVFKRGCFVVNYDE